ncbi:MAG TPA: hypothetical protein VI913_00075 [Candidatus Peribacteraceae bacterium]|nr:hypothetical protein [Candidatus Peribacteraceae bacterium]
MNKLLLLDNEREIFSHLSEGLKEGWQYEQEAFLAYETRDELQIRYRMTHFQDPAFAKLAQSAASIKSVDDVEKVAASFDITSVSQEDMAELFFVLGTRILSCIIAYALKHADSDDDVEGVMTLTHIRHSLFETNSSS